MDDEIHATHVIDSRQLPYGVSDHYQGIRGRQYARQRFARPLCAIASMQAERFFHRLTMPSDTVVDFGCGGGELLACMDVHRRIGIEIDADAQLRAESRGVEIYADTTRLPDLIADVVVSNHALEHVPYPIAALAELRRLLKPGGMLAAVVPIDDWRNQKTYATNDVPNHLHTWTAQSFGNTLREAGFSIHSGDIQVRSEYFGRPLLLARGAVPKPLLYGAARLWAIKRRHHEVFAIARVSE